MAPNVCRKTNEDLSFFGNHTQKSLDDLCGENLLAKVAKNFSGKFGESRVKILRPPQGC